MEFIMAVESFMIQGPGAIVGVMVNRKKPKQQRTKLKFHFSLDFRRKRTRF